MVTTEIGSGPRLPSVFCRRRHAGGATRRYILALAVLVLMVAAPGHARAGGPEGQLTWGVHISLAPTWLDPAEMSGIITPYMVYYALHDALVKPMPGKPFAPSLAESWSLSDDGLIYEFVLRKDAKFHNGEAVTSEDVKFSYERYRGSSSKALKDHVAAVETPDPLHVLFKLKEPWPDFLTFYAGATGAAWIVPKKYVEKQFRQVVGFPGIPDYAEVVKLDTWRDRCRRKGLSPGSHPDKRDESEKHAFRRAVRELEAGSWIGITNDSVWIIRESRSANSPRPEPSSGSDADEQAEAA